MDGIVNRLSFSVARVGGGNAIYRFLDGGGVDDGQAREVAGKVVTREQFCGSERIEEEKRNSKKKNLQNYPSIFD
ncbi:hypothetical protein CEXT_52371 [Caerostris extrusa]|uniref:Uncharacterized protein n=1 Tax=Caerostris extrusa TaxID=172846 RepID=A0AAV4RTB0_CAEEX|nr:hypothetical protein CEXT_52371 [Caerostris extrusa]